MGRKVMIDSDKLQELADMLDLGELASARALAHELADLDLRDAISAAQRRNHELHKLGRISDFDYEDNRLTLPQLREGGKKNTPR